MCNILRIYQKTGNKYLTFGVNVQYIAYLPENGKGVAVAAPLEL